jgi:hypothetical protein
MLLLTGLGVLRWGDHVCQVDLSGVGFQDTVHTRGVARLCVIRIAADVVAAICQQLAHVLVVHCDGWITTVWCHGALSSVFE